MSGIRLDLLLAECVGEVVKRCVEPRCQFPIWEAGGRDIALAKLKEMGVSDQPLTMVDIARAAGLLGPDPDVIVMEHETVRNSRKRKIGGRL